ncbi:MAG: 4Fe-4S binding protein [Candidatus Aquicultor sp.]
MRFRLSSYRRVIQAFFFILFFVLLGIAAKQSTLLFPAQLFLASDPLVALVSAIVGLPMLSILLYSVITFVVSILFGRVFCGYACPMGTFLDLLSPLARILSIDQKIFRKLKVVPLVMLSIVIIFSIFKISVFMIFDPIVLLTRTSAVLIFPAINLVLSKAAEGLYASLSLAPTIDSMSEQLNGILMFKEPRAFDSSMWIIMLFLSVVSLNVLGRRFWCRYLCPLGGLLGLVGRVSLFRKTTDAATCSGCMKCSKKCEMDAIAGNGLVTDVSYCMTCMKCRKTCPKEAISWGLKPELTTEIPSRRTAVTAVGGAIAAAYLAPIKSKGTLSPTLLRPPGALNEDKFLDKCIRCGECLKACPTNVLQPSLLQHGLEAFWAPHVDFGIGFCDWSCNACSMVCPTGAIEDLKLEAKQKFVIGTAEIDRTRCYPWVAGHGCQVCASLCPTLEKAITLKDTGKYDPSGMMLVLPYVVKENCIGCGICQANCPVHGDKAINVFRTEVKNPYQGRFNPHAGMMGFPQNDTQTTGTSTGTTTSP